MDILHRLRRYFGSKSILQAARFNKRDKKYLGIDGSQRIGILYEWSTANQHQLKQMLKSKPFSDKEIHLLGYSPQAEKGKPQPEGVFSRKEVNWKLQPQNNQTVQQFLSREYDLLLDLSPEDHIPLMYVLASANTKLAVSLFSPCKKRITDLMIHMNARPELDVMLKHMIHYLQQIQSAK